MPRKKQSPLKLHASWSFGDRRADIERVLNELETLFKKGDYDNGSVVAALLFALIGGLRDVRPDTAFAPEAKLVELSGLCLLGELDQMYRITSKKGARVH